MRTATPWSTQESSAGAVQGGVRASGGNTSKCPYTAAKEAGVQGPYGARPTQRREKGGCQENTGGNTSGVRGDGGGHEASGVAPESPGLGYK